MKEAISYSLKRVVGVRQTLRAIASGSAENVFLASDAEPALLLMVEQEAKKTGVSVEWVDTMKKLGMICHVQVPAAAAAVLKGES